MGRQCLREVLRHAPERVCRVLVAQHKHSRGGEDRQALLDELARSGVPVEYTSRSELTGLLGSDSHQSFAAVVTPPQAEDLRTFLQRTDAETPGVVLVADSVSDPHNLGAILRTAECFGVDAVMWSTNRGCGFTPVVAKASVGASELLRILEVSNLAESVGRLKEAGYWLVAADVSGDALDLAHFEFPARTVLVVGAEDRGPRQRLRQLADFIVKITMCGQIDSLNVAQATAVLLHGYRRQHAACK
jgi:23S rRNA (guanosine2251-2'-O)-methyltransferase